MNNDCYVQMIGVVTDGFKTSGKLVTQHLAMVHQLAGMMCFPCSGVLQWSMTCLCCLMDCMRLVPNSFLVPTHPKPLLATNHAVCTSTVPELEIPSPDCSLQRRGHEHGLPPAWVSPILSTHIVVHILGWHTNNRVVMVGRKIVIGPKLHGHACSIGSNSEPQTITPKTGTNQLLMFSRSWCSDLLSAAFSFSQLRSQH